MFGNTKRQNTTVKIKRVSRIIRYLLPSVFSSTESILFSKPSPDFTETKNLLAVNAYLIASRIDSVSNLAVRCGNRVSCTCKHMYVCCDMPSLYEIDQDYIHTYIYRFLFPHVNGSCSV